MCEKLDRKIAKSAWLVTWDGATDDEDIVVAVLNWRKGATKVAEFVETLHTTLLSNPSEKAFFANRPSSNPYRAQAEHFDRIHCGHIPFLYARRVTDIMADGDGITWTEPPTISEMWRRVAELHGVSAVPEPFQRKLKE